MACCGPFPRVLLCLGFLQAGFWVTVRFCSFAPHTGSCRHHLHQGWPLERCWRVPSRASLARERSAGGLWNANRSRPLLPSAWCQQDCAATPTVSVRETQRSRGWRGVTSHPRALPCPAMRPDLSLACRELWGLHAPNCSHHSPPSTEMTACPIPAVPPTLQKRQLTPRTWPDGILAIISTLGIPSGSQMWLFS